MEIIIHRVNSIQKLKKIPVEFGCEIDIRANNKTLYLNHEPYSEGVSLNDFLDHYNHGTLVLNIKEAGIEEAVLNEVKRRGLTKYFLLDVEFPYIFKSYNNGNKNIAIRFSEKEPIENITAFDNFFNWIWIDTNTKLPIIDDVIGVLSKNNTCLVCPERWGRPQDIIKYLDQLKRLNYFPNAVMTSLEHSKTYLDFLNES